jgi:hypothetical protein
VVNDVLSYHLQALFKERHGGRIVGENQIDNGRRLRHHRFPGEGF